MKSKLFEERFVSFLSFNIILIPIFLVSGPFLSDLSLSLCALSFLLYIFFFKQISLLKNYFFVFFCFFYIIILISSLFSDNTLYSLKSSLPYIRFGLFVMCMVYVSRFDENLFKKIFLSLSIIYMLLIFDGYLQFFTGTNILNYQKTGVRISSFFGDEHVLGSYLVRFLPIYIGLYLITLKNRTTNLFEKVFFIFFCLLISGLILISGERTALGLLILSLIFLLLFLNGFKKIKLTFITLLIFISFISLGINKNIFNRIVIETKNQIITEDKIYFFGQRRHEYAQVSINIFKENIFFGSGPKTYRIKSKDEKFKISELSWNTHPHNIYFQLLSETGVFGTILVLTLFIYIVLFVLKTSFKNKIKYLKIDDNINICVGIAIIINLFPLIPSGNFFNNWMSIIFFYPIGIFFAFTHKINLKN